MRGQRFVLIEWGPIVGFQAGASEKVATCKAGRELTPEPNHTNTLISASSLQGCKKTDLCRVSHSACAILLRGLKLTKTGVPQPCCTLPCPTFFSMPQSTGGKGKSSFNRGFNSAEADSPGLHTAPSRGDLLTLPSSVPACSCVSL